ncbi:MAG: hypothetical protein HY719_14720 [Planctomycetes bacterium]|nr:hypothetical protein [Planctomycetota bacterium]
MPPRPDAPTLLDAVARFLSTDLLPVVADRALRFRLLIAANLVNVAAGEARHPPLDLAGEVAALGQVLGENPDPNLGGLDAPALAARFEECRARFQEGLRAGTLDGSPGSTAWTYAVDQLRGALAVSSPSFDLSTNI